MLITLTAVRIVWMFVPSAFDDIHKSIEHPIYGVNTTIFHMVNQGTSVITEVFLISKHQGILSFGHQLDIPIACRLFNIVFVHAISDPGKVWKSERITVGVIIVAVSVDLFFVASIFKDIWVICKKLPLDKGPKAQVIVYVILHLLLEFLYVMLEPVLVSTLNDTDKAKKLWRTACTIFLYICVVSFVEKRFSDLVHEACDVVKEPSFFDGSRHSFLQVLRYFHHARHLFHWGIHMSVLWDAPWVATVFHIFAIAMDAWEGLCKPTETSVRIKQDQRRNGAEEESQADVREYWFFKGWWNLASDCSGQTSVRSRGYDAVPNI